MRKSIYKIVIIPAIIVIAGCAKYLDIKPERELDADNLSFENTAQMYMPVSGVYAIAATNFSFWGGQGLSVVRGDDVNKGGSTPDQVEFNYAKTFQYNRLASYWALNSCWTGSYAVVNGANTALKSLDKYAEYLTTEDQKKLNKSYKAEVRFLRAYAYFRISNFWGSAPIVLSDTVRNPKKSSQVQIRQFIIDELTECVQDLPDLRPNERTEHIGAITKHSALALLAKVYLYNGDYESVLSKTNEIINSGKFSLYSDYYNLFKVPGKLSNESLYELQFTDFGSGSGEIARSDQWFMFQGPAGQNLPSHISGWSFIAPTQGLIDFFTARGETVRAKATFLFAGQATPSGDIIGPAPDDRPTCYNGKAYTPSNQLTVGRTYYGDNNNVRVLRYADVLLMNAEAKVRLGQNGDAPLNLVRTRATLPNITGATLQNVLDERRAELAIEWGERFYDLIRTDKAQTVLPGFVKGQSEFYPIPQEQKDLNPNL